MWRLTVRRRKHAVALTLLLPAIVFSASHVYAATLNEALLAAYLTNPDLRAKQVSSRRSDEQVTQATAGWRPTVDLNLGLGQVTVSMTENIYKGGGTVAATRQAENLVRSEQADLVATEQNVLFQAVQAYTAVWRTMSVLDEARKNEQRFVRQLTVTRDRFELGQVPNADVIQAEARRSGVAADSAKAKSDLETAQSTYERVVGSDPKFLADPVPIDTLPPTLDDVLALALDNPEILNAAHQLDAAQNAVTVARANLLPSLDLQAQYLYAEESTPQPSGVSPFSSSTTFGVQLTVPLYHGGDRSRLRDSRQAVQQQQWTLESIRRSVKDRAQAAWSRRQAARTAIASYRAQARANESALKVVQEAALIGTRTILDVLDAQQDLFSSRVSLVSSRGDEVNASYELKAVIGQLTVKNLHL